MRLFFGKLFLLLIIAALTLAFDGYRALEPVGGPSSAFAKEKPDAPKATIERGHVYLLRGLGNIWSRGIDELGEKLEAEGVRLSVHNHRYWKELAAEAAEKYKSEKDFAPVVIIGHSLGASASVLMANKMGEYGVPVRLVIAFDGLAHAHGTKAAISRNVEEVLNFYNGSLLGIEMVPGRAFKGKIENVDVRDVEGAGHLKIDKNPELQARVTALVLDVLAEKGRTR